MNLDQTRITLALWYIAKMQQRWSKIFPHNSALDPPEWLHHYLSWCTIFWLSIMYITMVPKCLENEATIHCKAYFCTDDVKKYNKEVNTLSFVL